MKKYLKINLAVLMTFLSLDTLAATCTSPSRTNVSANSVLTSTEYNASLNSLYSAIASGALDLGCAAAGSLDDVATLDSTEFNALLNGVKEGCVVSASDTNTLSVDNCMMAVNGNFVKTTTATTVTWGCSGCSAEAATSIYYLKAKTGSTGSTLNLLIDQTAPNADGYDNSGNRILAIFVNNFSSNIESVLNAVQGNKYRQDWYVDASIAGANPSLGVSAVTTYTQIGDASLTMTVNSASILTRVPCSTTNPPTGLTCSTGTEQLGVSFVLPVASKVEVCASFAHDATVDNNEELLTTFELVETPTNATTITQDGTARVMSSSSITLATASTFENATPFHLCSIFNMSTSGQKVFKLVFEQSVTGTPNASTIWGDAGANNGQRDINFTVRPVYQ